MIRIRDKYDFWKQNKVVFRQEEYELEKYKDFYFGLRSDGFIIYWGHINPYNNSQVILYENGDDVKQYFYLSDFKKVVK